MASESESTLRLGLDTRNCFVCGPDNPNGLHVKFEREGEHGCRASYTAREEHCGWPGLLHGGVACALLDEGLAWALYFQGFYGVTARVEIRFKQPIRAGAKLTIRAWTLERKRRLVNAKAEIRLDREDGEDNALLAEADATMYLQESEKG